MWCERRYRGDYDDVLVGGSLYMCGQSKAGQLGLEESVLHAAAERDPVYGVVGNTTSKKGKNAGVGSKENVCVWLPTRVTHLEDQGFRTVNVSCGFHHTLIIGMPLFAVRTFSTSVFSCGWGDHGRRLGPYGTGGAPASRHRPLSCHRGECW